MSYYIWIDDERTTPEVAINGKPFDFSATTTNQATKAIHRKYKEGVRDFFIDIDNDTEDALTNTHGGEFYNVLLMLEQLCHMGRMKDVHFDVRIHTGNPAARQRMRALIAANKEFTEMY